VKVDLKEKKEKNGGINLAGGGVVRRKNIPRVLKLGNMIFR